MSHRLSERHHQTRDVPDLAASNVLTLLERVEDRDRAILAMLHEHVPPDDIAATVGISGAAFRRRRARILARLSNPPTPRASTQLVRIDFLQRQRGAGRAAEIGSLDGPDHHKSPITRS